MAWAERAGAIVVEDDYDSAYRYEGRPIPALFGLDRSGRVVYVGTFSKTMFPALRIGYVVVPPALRDVVAAAKAFSDRQSPALEQRALASSSPTAASSAICGACACSTVRAARRLLAALRVTSATTSR